MATNSKTTDDKETRPRVGPVEFVRQVRQETAKVTWPTGSEWRITTLMVFIMVAVATLFFFTIDSLIQLVVGMLLTR